MAAACRGSSSSCNSSSSIDPWEQDWLTTPQPAALAGTEAAASTEAAAEQLAPAAGTEAAAEQLPLLPPPPPPQPRTLMPRQWWAVWGYRYIVQINNRVVTANIFMASGPQFPDGGPTPASLLQFWWPEGRAAIPTEWHGEWSRKERTWARDAVAVLQWLRANWRTTWSISPRFQAAVRGL